MRVQQLEEEVQSLQVIAAEAGAHEVTAGALERQLAGARDALGVAREGARKEVEALVKERDAARQRAVTAEGREQALDAAVKAAGAAEQLRHDAEAKERRTLALRCAALEESVNVHCSGERSARELVADLRVQGEVAGRRHAGEMETLARRFEAEEAAAFGEVEESRRREVAQLRCEADATHVALREGRARLADAVEELGTTKDALGLERAWRTDAESQLVEVEADTDAQIRAATVESGRLAKDLERAVEGHEVAREESNEARRECMRLEHAVMQSQEEAAQVGVCAAEGENAALRRADKSAAKVRKLREVVVVLESDIEGLQRTGQHTRHSHTSTSRLGGGRRRRRLRLAGDGGGHGNYGDDDESEGEGNDDDDDDDDEEEFGGGMVGRLGGEGLMSTTASTHHGDPSLLLSRARGVSFPQAGVDSSRPIRQSPSPPASPGGEAGGAHHSHTPGGGLVGMVSLRGDGGDFSDQERRGQGRGTNAGGDAGGHKDGRTRGGHITMAATMASPALSLSGNGDDDMLKVGDLRGFGSPTTISNGTHHSNHGYNGAEGGDVEGREGREGGEVALTPIAAANDRSEVDPRECIDGLAIAIAWGTAAAAGEQQGGGGGGDAGVGGDGIGEGEGSELSPLDHHLRALDNDAPSSGMFHAPATPATPDASVASVAPTATAVSPNLTMPPPQGDEEVQRRSEARNRDSRDTRDARDDTREDIRDARRGNTRREAEEQARHDPEVRQLLAKADAKLGSSRNWRRSSSPNASPNTGGRQERREDGREKGREEGSGEGRRRGRQGGGLAHRQVRDEGHMHEFSRSNSSSSEDDIDFFYGRGRDGGGSRHNDVGGELSRGDGSRGGRGVGGDREEDYGEYAEYADAGSYLGGSVGPSRRRAGIGDRVVGGGGTGVDARPRWSMLHSEPPSALLSRNSYHDMVLRRRMPAGMPGVGGRRALLSQSMPIARGGGASRGAVRSRPLPYTGRKPHPSLRR